MTDIVSIAAVDVDCKLDKALVQAVAECITIHTQRDFSAARWGYGLGAAVTVRPSVAAALPGERLLLLLKQPDQPGALGYHDLTRVMKVFPFLAPLDQLAVTATHEVDEDLADDDCVTLVLGQDGRLRLREPGDPVETLSYPITLSSGQTMLATNFVGKDWFDGGAPGKAQSLDFLGKCRAPGEILSGGYQSFFNPTAGFTQEQVDRKSPYREAMATLARLGLHATRHDQAVRMHRTLGSRILDLWDARAAVRA